MPCRDYLDYLDHLGFSIVAPAYSLRLIDRFLVENNIACIQQCDNRFWLELLAQHQGRVKANTLQIWRRTFHGLCRYLVRQGWIPENPVAAFPIPKLEHYRPYVFSIEELRRFFDCLQQQADDAPRSADFIPVSIPLRFLSSHLCLRIARLGSHPAHHSLTTRPSSAPCSFSPRSSSRIV